MNNWLKLAVFAFIGIIVSSLSLGALTYVNGSGNNMGGMNMGATNSANMNMGNTNPANTNMGNMGSQNMPFGEGYAMNPGMANGNNPMRNWMFDRANRMKTYAGYGAGYANPYVMGPGNMNMAPGQMSNMNMNQGQMQMNGMNMGGGQAQMNMNQGQMPMNNQGMSSGMGMSSSHM
jgi:hypothetical protein